MNLDTEKTPLAKGGTEPPGNKAEWEKSPKRAGNPLRLRSTEYQEMNGQQLSGVEWTTQRRAGQGQLPLDKVTLEISEGQIEVAAVTNEDLQTRSDRPLSNWVINIMKPSSIWEWVAKVGHKVSCHKMKKEERKTERGRVWGSVWIGRDEELIRERAKERSSI